MQSKRLCADYTFKEYDENGNLLRRLQRSLRLRYVFRYEMEHLLSLSGFKVEAVYGSFDKRPYDYKSGEMIFIAKA